MRTSPWLLRPPGGRPASLRLFCFPYAGGGGSLYMPWAREAPSALEVCAVQLAGRESRLRERPYTAVTELMDATLAALQPYLDVPFALFGHSMGALLAFEFARRIRRAGGPTPVRLFVSGHRAPQLPCPHPPLAHLPDTAFVAEVRQRYDGVPDEVLQHADLLALLLPCLRADMALIEGYRYAKEEPLECAISAYGGREDAEASEAELAAWQTQTRGPFMVQQFAGAHFYIRAARRELMGTLCRDLAGVAEPAFDAMLP
jgi:medium-chain acyl-[acyl-carrier-protein] hydrolase